MILYNPISGAPIKDVWYESVKYFAQTEGELFSPGDIIEVEDEIGKFVLSLYGFIEEISEQKAANLLKEKEKQIKCSECEFRARDEENLKGHMTSHKSKATIKSKLGLKVIGKKEKEEKKTLSEEDFDRQQEIEADNKRDGLDVGDGLQRESLGV